MHLLENGSHAMLSTFFLSHLGELTLRNGGLLVSFLQLFVGQKVLRHDTGDLFEIVKNSEASILDFIFRWAESFELIVQIKGSFWI